MMRNYRNTSKLALGLYNYGVQYYFIITFFTLQLALIAVSTM